MALTLIESLIGSAPEELEFMEYIFAGIISLVVINGILSIFQIPFNKNKRLM